MRPHVVVFLDVDGVLLPFGDGAPTPPHDGGFPPEPLAALSFLLEHSEATLVLSSTWRCAPAAIAELTSAFFFYACEYGGPLGRISAFEHTTSLTHHSERQWEIAEWLRTPAAAGVGRWVALDDEELLEGASCAKHRAAFEGHAVKTQSHVGLTRAHAILALQLLEWQKAPTLSSDRLEASWLAMLPSDNSPKATLRQPSSDRPAATVPTGSSPSESARVMPTPSTATNGLARLARRGRHKRLMRLLRLRWPYSRFGRALSRAWRRHAPSPTIRIGQRRARTHGWNARARRPQGAPVAGKLDTILSPPTPTPPSLVASQGSDELPSWSRTYAGYRGRFVEPYTLPLRSGRGGTTHLVLEQMPCVSSEHAREAKHGADGSCTGSTVWDAGIVLAAHVHATHRAASRSANGPPRTRLLDLGAGTGVCGLAAALSGGFERVVLSDLPSVVPLLERNVARNAHKLPRDTRVEALGLAWDDEPMLHEAARRGPYSCIVGGDLLYRPQVVAPLLTALGALTQPATIVLLAASLQHSPETIDAFAAAAARAGFSVECLGQEAIEGQWASPEVRVLRLTRV